jgi:hypothetical protein
MENLIRSKTSPRLTIAVPQDIIDSSAVKDSSHCMIAEAISRAVPKATYVSVDLATIRFTDRVAGVRYIYLTPRGAQQALLQFDDGEKPEAFTFTLRDAHVVASGTASKGRVSLEQNPRGDRNSPIRVGGQVPPTGPLATGSGTARKAHNARSRAVKAAAEDAGVPNRTGRRREFGLRAIIR